MPNPQLRTPAGKYRLLHEDISNIVILSNGLSEVRDHLVEIAANHPETAEAIRFTLLTLGAVSEQIRAVQRDLISVNLQLAMETDNPDD